MVITTFFRLSGMRRSAGATTLQSTRWAAGLLWRNHQTTRRRRHLERRAEIERAARQRF